MSLLPELLYRGYTRDGQFVSVEQMRLVHNGRRVVLLTVNRDSFELDLSADDQVIEGIGRALLSSLPREQVAS